MAKPFSYLAPSAVQAPKTGLRKEDDIYANAASIYTNNTDEPSHYYQPDVMLPTPNFGGPPVGGGPPIVGGPPVAAKPAATRSDRPPGFETDWRLRSDVSIGPTPNVGSSMTSLAERGPSDASTRPTRLADSNERIVTSFRNAPHKPPEVVGPEAAPAFGSGMLIAPSRPISMLPVSANNEANDEENSMSQYASAADLIRNAAAAAAAKNTPVKNDQPRRVAPLAPLAPLVEDVGSGRSPTEEGDVGGGIFENFILVGAPHSAGPSQHQQTHEPPPKSNRLEGLFVGAQTTPDYVIKSAAGPTAAAVADRSGGGRDVGVDEVAGGRSPIFVEENMAGSRNGFDEDPKYTFYSGVQATPTVVAVPDERQTQSNYSGHSVFTSPTKPPSWNDNRKPTKDDDDEGSGCRCSVCVIVLVVIIIALVFFGVGFIAGWFGRSPSSTSALAPVTPLTLETSTAPVAGATGAATTTTTTTTNSPPNPLVTTSQEPSLATTTSNSSSAAG